MSSSGRGGAGGGGLAARAAPAANVLTGRLYFDDDLNEVVYQTAPHTDHTG
ncbi:MAG: hypothetical protein ABWX59_08250 [Microbacteriaceae bacterium]